MHAKEIFELAEKYLKNREVPFVTPGDLGRLDGEQAEVIFLIPEALNPNLVVDPPDVRVLVNTKTKEVTWVEQM